MAYTPIGLCSRYNMLSIIGGTLAKMEFHCSLLVHRMRSALWATNILGDAR